MSRASLRLGAQAIGLVTHAAPAVGGRSLTEGYLTQPLLAAHGEIAGGRLAFSGMLNGEAFTLRRGELNAGIYGEGYVDRRHPHTLLHELTATVNGEVGGSRWSLTGGKGFAPFGTDDPMVRPFAKYPVNHHLAQILERGVAIAAVRRGTLMVEAGLFNGDEPGSPEDVVNWRRFGDSWAVRGTALPRPGVELSASYAAVASPEFPAGSGLDHRKWSAAARWERPGGYALLEWARTDEFIGAEPTFRFPSVLGEASLEWRGFTGALRLERTVRPEEERTLDPFRSPRPHADVHLLGATRWTLASAALSAPPLGGGPLRLRPFVEVSHARAKETLGSLVWDPAEFYGSASQWGLSAGVRAEVGTMHRRMGRYGAALAGPGNGHSH